MKQCPNCSTIAGVNAAFCARCGHQFSTSIHQTQYFAPVPQPVYSRPGHISRVPGTHSVAAVVIVSLFIGGWLGQVLNGQTAKGLLIGLLCGIVVSVATCGWGLLLWWPLTFIDACVIAGRINRGELVSEWQWF